MDVAIVGAVRTPRIRRGSTLDRSHAVDLLGASLSSVLAQARLTPAVVDSVVVGCSRPVGEQALNVARNAVLAQGWPASISAATVDAGPLSGIVAIGLGVDALRAGTASVVVVGGVDSARVPAGATTGTAVGKPFGPALAQRYLDDGGLVPPGVVAHRLAEHHGLDTGELHDLARASRQRARSVQRHMDELVQLGAVDSIDEWRDVVDAELAPLFPDAPTMTAATFPVSVSATSCVALMDRARARAVDVAPLAVIRAYVHSGADPLTGDTGADVIDRVLKAAGVVASDIDRVGVHEDSAVTPLLVARGFPDLADRINPEGGALAFGECGAAEGPALLASLVHGMRANDERWGLVVTAGALGGSAAVVVECSER